MTGEPEGPHAKYGLARVGEHRPRLGVCLRRGRCVPDGGEPPTMFPVLQPPGRNIVGAVVPRHPGRYEIPGFATLSSGCWSGRDDAPSGMAPPGGIVHRRAPQVALSPRPGMARTQAPDRQKVRTEDDAVQTRRCLPTLRGGIVLRQTRGTDKNQSVCRRCESAPSTRGLSRRDDAPGREATRQGHRPSARSSLRLLSGRGQERRLHNADPRNVDAARNRVHRTMGPVAKHLVGDVVRIPYAHTPHRSVERNGRSSGLRRFRKTPPRTKERCMNDTTTGSRAQGKATTRPLKRSL